MRLSKIAVKNMIARLGLQDSVPLAKVIGIHLSKSPHEEDYRFFGLMQRRSGLFLDVGANFGQSAVSFALFKPDFAIVSVEPNPATRRVLTFVSRFLLRRHRTIAKGIDALPDRELKLYVPRSGLLRATEEATLHRNELETEEARQRISHAFGSSQFDVEELTVPLVSIDRLHMRPDVVKVDVQGNELSVLESMRRTLEKTKPILMVENGDCIPQVERLLAAYHYRRYLFDSARGELYRPHSSQIALNHFFIHPHEESDPGVKAALTS